MIRALLFDLDDTLLVSRMDTFLPQYFRALTKKLAHLIPPQKLVADIMASTQAMMSEHDPMKTNQEVFAADFFPRIGVPVEALMPIFDDFYAHDFAALRAFTQPKPEAKPLIERAFAHGYQVVIATQPVFPAAAVRQRLEWAGVADFPYALVTTYENMHACKPHRRYYEEIIAVIGRPPEECLMIGNDVRDDIAPAASVGIRTFWLQGSKYEQAADLPDVPADFRGTLADLERLIFGAGDLSLKR